MDSWKYLCEGKGGLLSEDLDFSMDGGRCKSKSLGCEFKPLFNIENFPLVSNTQALERLDLVDLGFYDEIRKSYSVSSEPSGEVFSDEIGADSYGNVVSPFCEERDLGSSQISTDFGHSNKQDCTLFDLKLGSKESGVLKAQDSGLCVPAKRPRLMALNPRPPCCQVLGCNKDLSSCKSYYKRHKVCDAHTKTSKVIVDGIEQRFCQQCSRFHLLNEFDDRKRSCRRRLAAHNKRRRKPQLTSESGSGIIGFSSPFAFPGGGEGPNVLSGQGGSNMNGILQRSRALSLLSAQSSSSGFHAPQMLSMKADVADPKSTVMNPQGGVMIDLKGPTSSAISWGPQPQPQPQPRPQSQPVLEKTNNCQGSSILDLLQLSSHLQRIEQQRHSTECDGG